MSTSAVPSIIDALVTAARAALTDVAVYDGYGVSDDPGDFLMIGVEDVDGQDQARSADSSQTWAGTGIGAPRDESGEITCAALSWNGDADQKAARDGAYAITAAVENLLRENPALGLPTVLWTGYGSSTQLTQDQSDGGAMALVVFRIAFRARI